MERYNRTIIASLSACTDDETTWDLFVEKVKWGLNSTTNSTTGKTPYEVMFGYKPRGLADSLLVNEVFLPGTDNADLQKLRA